MLVIGLISVTFSVPSMEFCWFDTWPVAEPVSFVHPDPMHSISRLLVSRVPSMVSPFLSIGLSFDVLTGLQSDPIHTVLSSAYCDFITDEFTCIASISPPPTDRKLSMAWTSDAGIWAEPVAF